MLAYYHVYLKCGGYITVRASCVRHCKSIIPESKEIWLCFFSSGSVDNEICSIPQDVIDHIYVFDDYGRKISDWRE